MRLPPLALLVGTLVLLLAGSPAGGQPLRLLRHPGAVPTATVIVQGVTVLRLRGPDAETRADAVLRRIGDVLAQRPAALAVALRPRPGAVDLVLNDRHLVTVDEAQARANRMTPDALATVWAARLRQAFAHNTVSLDPGVVLLAPGREAAVAVNTFLPAPLTIGPYDGRIVAVRVTAAGLLIRARSVGSTLVPVIAGGGWAPLRIVVRREAGTIPPEVVVRVTGDLGNLALLREAVQRRVDQMVVREPGAAVTIGPLPPLEGMAAETAAATLSVPVQVRSPYALPVEGIVRVSLVRETVAVVDPAVLLVSNRPEVVEADGILFAETVDARRAVRLLYHHMNGTREYSRILTVVLTNRSGEPAEMLLLSGLAGPSPDALYVGHAATVRFLQNLVVGRGYVLEIPPRSSYAFTAQVMPPLQLVSGILQLQLLRGDELAVRVQVRLPWLLEGTVALPINQIAYPHPKGIFPLPTVTIERRVDLPQAGTIVDLGGAAALVDERTGEPLIGDYGVVYRMTITAANASAQEVQADLVATAAGGPARGVFLIDGRLVEMAIFRPLEERVLATVAIGARQTVQMRVVTMPTAGSYYPVRLSLRARE